MFKQLFAFSLVIFLATCVSVPLFAQDIQNTKSKFLAVQECDHVVVLTQKTVINWGEKPLVKSIGTQFGPNDAKYKSSMMYFVNQDTGTWSLIALYPNNMACLIAAGTKFEPYTD